MLLVMSLRDFVLVDHLEIDFQSGMTVLTGETGAGKSLLVDALSLVMGGRADASVVRDGATRAEMSAEFEVKHLLELQQYLKDSDLDDGMYCVLRRVIDNAGRSRGFINGRTASVQQLREVGEYLVDLHGQHAHQSLLKSSYQRTVLDAYAGVEELAQQVSRHFRNYRERITRLTELRSNQDVAQTERERLQWQVDELATLNFDAEIWEADQARHLRLANVMQLGSGVGAALDSLSEGDVSVRTQLQIVRHHIGGLITFDERLTEILALLDSAGAELEEASHSLRQYADKLDADPEQLSELEQHIAQVMGIARKYRVRPEDLGEYCAAATVRLNQLGAEADLSELAKQADAEYQAWHLCATQLSEIRASAAKKLSTEVSELMQCLALAGGCFAIALQPLLEGDAHGLEQIEFMVAPHEGAGLKPLAKVASGGELSRISLALQTVISRVAAVPVLVFDEVDVGIGGKVAEAVGKLLRQLAENRQVLCITHLPQVAAQGMQHIQVTKIKPEQGAVISCINTLTGVDRVDEIARMLGGAVITDTTRTHALEMLQMAVN